MSENIKRIKGFEDYGIDLEGNVWTFKRNPPRILAAYDPPPLYIVCKDGVAYKKSKSQLKKLLTDEDCVLKGLDYD